jgi:hypothetical protein
MISPPVEVASIILYQEKQFLMQLRENIQGIILKICPIGYNIFIKKFY